MTGWTKRTPSRRRQPANDLPEHLERQIRHIERTGTGYAIRTCGSTRDGRLVAAYALRNGLVGEQYACHGVTIDALLKEIPNLPATERQRVLQAASVKGVYWAERLDFHQRRLLADALERG